MERLHWTWLSLRKCSRFSKPMEPIERVTVARVVVDTEVVLKVVAVDCYRGSGHDTWNISLSMAVACSILVTITLMNVKLLMLGCWPGFNLCPVMNSYIPWNSTWIVRTQAVLAAEGKEGNRDKVMR
eukprot:scaffold351_cov162-Ochromonas_danica.AAC.24